jgi:hypothetical protein
MLCVKPSAPMSRGMKLTINFFDKPSGPNAMPAILAYPSGEFCNPSGSSKPPKKLGRMTKKLWSARSKRSLRRRLFPEKISNHNRFVGHSIKFLALDMNDRVMGL